ncbi:uncharacterized protein N0V89_005841 [Didymosphaeria variabile]|uniref:RING-type domain-containing protein n=1 Tax=Didymosphaeria variabile TaxID=1932322 RepID=A0A9W8XNN0_9PLEO|nr:uncharacterized protein N0V89_005841 [Didymosphaeria variabile]KAJ4354108.1 hypothetical protein N0V89_005841 [Didymosphaeria variabile]
MADYAFPVVSQYGLAYLLHRTDHIREVREVLKFLATVVAHIVQVNPPLGHSTFFFEDQLSRYDPQTSIAINLAFFGSTYSLTFEMAVRDSIGLVRGLDFSLLSKEHDHPALIQLKLWLLRCALHTSLSDALSVKLAVLVGPQPILANLPPPSVIPHEISGNDNPEMARAMFALANKARDSRESIQDDDAFHILREFMRLALNCAEVWNKYGPKEWNFAAEGMPELSEPARYAGLKAVSDCWRRMIENPFSNAPLHIRWILAKCDMIAAANYFLVDVQQSLNRPFPSLMNIQRLAQHFVQQVQWAAEDIQYDRFYAYRATRLGNPFLGPVLPPGAFAPPLMDLHTHHSLDLVRGIPQPNAMDLPDERDIELPHLAAQQNPFDTLIDQVFGPDPEENVGPDLCEFEHYAQQPLLYEHAPAYAGELHLAVTPEIVAVGPLIEAHQLSDQIETSDLQAEDECLICQVLFRGNVTPTNPGVRLRACGHMLHLEDLKQLVNGAYWQQPYVRCPACRAHICASRETRQAVAG